MYGACAHACTASRCMCMCAARVGAAPRRPRCPLSRTIGERGQGARAQDRWRNPLRTVPSSAARRQGWGDGNGPTGQGTTWPTKRPTPYGRPYDISCKCKSKALTPPSHTKMRAVAWRAWLRARFRMAEGVACRRPPRAYSPGLAASPLHTCLRVRSPPKVNPPNVTLTSQVCSQICMPLTHLFFSLPPAPTSSHESACAFNAPYA